MGIGSNKHVVAWFCKAAIPFVDMRGWIIKHCQIIVFLML